MPIQLPDARQLSDEALQVLRLRALRGIELGFSELDLADLLGVCHETIRRWWTAYCTQGLDSLPGERSGRPVGTGRLLSDQQGSLRKRAMAMASVSKRLGVWSLDALRAVIARSTCLPRAGRRRP